MKVNGVDVGNTPEEQVRYIANQAKGIPDFAKKLLVQKMGFSKKFVESTDRAARKDKTGL